MTGNKKSFSILYVYAMPHTGSSFIRRVLLAGHEAISPPMTEVELFSDSACTPLKYGDGIQDLSTGDAFLAVLEAIYHDRYTYVEIDAFTNAHWFWPVVLFPPCSARIVVPLRSPYNVLSSYYKRPASFAIGWPIMSWYLTQLYILRHLKDVFVLPVDVLEAMTPEGRYSFVESFFQDFLGLGVSQSLKDIIYEWRRINTSEDKELSEQEDNEIHRRLFNSNVYRELSLSGINYYEEEAVYYEEEAVKFQKL